MSDLSTDQTGPEPETLRPSPRLALVSPHPGDPRRPGCPFPVGLSDCDSCHCTPARKVKP